MQIIATQIINPHSCENFDCSGKTPKHELQKNRAEQINPACQCQQYQGQERTGETPFLHSRQERNFFLLGEHLATVENVESKSSGQIR
ncbi:MAG: hypothetical protein ACJ8FZ_00725 [Bradyrhizobium sp.]